MIMKSKSNNSGVTLIALVVTIIVLMILAGIAVAALMGDNGIIKRAGEAKESQRGAAVFDEVTLAIAENEMIDQLNSVNGGQENKKTKTDIVNELVTKGYLTSDDQTILETEDEITIGSIKIDFSGLAKGTTTSSNLTEIEKLALAENGIEEITGDNISNSNLKNNNRIKAVITGNVPITNEMTYVTGTKDTGVVVSINENEFVWVPVPIAIWDGTTTIEGATYTPMAKLQSGSTQNYEGMLYVYPNSIITYDYPGYPPISPRGNEPQILAEEDTDAHLNFMGFTADSFSIFIQNEYNKMVSSVNKYGGFYVSRYWLGAEVKNEEAGETQILVSKPFSETLGPISQQSEGGNWYGLYKKANSFYSESENYNIVSQMIWGSQFDAMMNWMIKSGININSDTSFNNILYLGYGYEEWTQTAGSSSGRISRKKSNSSNEGLATRTSIYVCEAQSQFTRTTRSTLYIKE